MNASDLQALQLLVGGLAGALFQKYARAPEGVPMWVFYGGVGISAALLYFWSNPNVVAEFTANWRLGLMKLVAWVLMVRGGAAGAKDVRLAGAANSQ